MGALVLSAQLVLQRKPDACCADVQAGNIRRHGPRTAPGPRERICARRAAGPGPAGLERGTEAEGPGRGPRARLCAHAGQGLFQAGPSPGCCPQQGFKSTTALNNCSAFGAPKQLCSWQCNKQQTAAAPSVFHQWCPDQCEAGRQRTPLSHKPPALRTPGWSHAVRMPLQGPAPPSRQLTTHPVLHMPVTQSACARPVSWPCPAA